VERLEQAQQQFVETVLKEQGETLAKYGFLPWPAKENVCEAIIEDIVSE